MTILYLQFFLTFSFKTITYTNVELQHFGK